MCGAKAIELFLFIRFMSWTCVCWGALMNGNTASELDMDRV